MRKLDHKLLQLVKQSFVPSGQSQAEPVAGAGPMTAGLANPVGGDPAAMGMDPAMAGMDPAAMGMDPAMMGMDPAAMGMDPAMMGAAGAMPPPAPAAGTITLSVPELIQLVQAFNGAGGSKKPKMKEEQAPVEGAGNSSDAKLDRVIQLLEGALGGQPM